MSSHDEHDITDMIEVTNMIIHLNGQFLEDHEARVSVFDRGFLFGDGVYESIRYFGEKPVMMQAHVDRLGRSLKLIGIGNFDPNVLDPLSRQLLRENGLTDAGVYWQITRGCDAYRSHVPGSAAMQPTIFGYAWELPSLDIISSQIEETACILRRDDRWLRCDIKSLNLLPNILAQMEAEEVGAGEAILHRDGFVTEAASSNVWIWDDGSWVTPPLTPPLVPPHSPPHSPRHFSPHISSSYQSQDYSILAGVTRQLILNLSGINITVRPVTMEEIIRAKEILITSSTKLLRAVIRLDEKPVGNGFTGARTRELHRRLIEALRCEL